MENVISLALAHGWEVTEHDLTDLPDSEWYLSLDHGDWTTLTFRPTRTGYLAFHHAHHNEDRTPTLERALSHISGKHQTHPLVPVDRLLKEGLVTTSPGSRPTITKYTDHRETP